LRSTEISCVTTVVMPFGSYCQQVESMNNVHAKIAWPAKPRSRPIWCHMVETTADPDGIDVELMGWTAPAERHRVPDVVVVGRRHRRGAVRHAGYHHRS
jgi:hypothetical protein